MFMALLPGPICAAIGLGLVRALDAVEHIAKQRSIKSLVK
jgi:hypothetical protein